MIETPGEDDGDTLHIDRCVLGYARGDLRTHLVSQVVLGGEEDRDRWWWPEMAGRTLKAGILVSHNGWRVCKVRNRRIWANGRSSVARYTLVICCYALFGIMDFMIINLNFFLENSP